MAEEMMALIGEAPESGVTPVCFVPEVSAASGGRIVVVTHWVDNKYDVNGLEQQGFKLRRRQLMGHLRGALDEIPDTPRAIREAFSRMNSELECSILKGSYCEGGYWLCQYNSTVVVVGSGNVHVAGVSGAAAVILSRAGKDIRLTDRALMRDIDVYRGSVEKITDLCYYRKERLKEDDEFLTICTSHTLAHVDGDFTPVLTTRVAAFGLVEAAKQIAGEYIDDTRTFVIVPLQGGADLCIKQKAEADLNYPGVKKQLENVEAQIAGNVRRRSEAVVELCRLKQVIRNLKVERKEKLRDLKRELQSKEAMLVELEQEMKDLELKQDKGKGDAKFFRKKRQEYIARNVRRRSEGLEEVRKLKEVIANLEGEGKEGKEELRDLMREEVEMLAALNMRDFELKQEMARAVANYLRVKEKVQEQISRNASRRSEAMEDEKKAMLLEEAAANRECLRLKEILENLVEKLEKMREEEKMQKMREEEKMQKMREEEKMQKMLEVEKMLVEEKLKLEKEKLKLEKQKLMVETMLEKLEKSLEVKLLARKMKAAEESEPGKLGWVNSAPLFPPIPDDEWEKMMEQAMTKRRDYYEKHPEERCEMKATYDSAPLLKPLENGERQTPEPHTWCGGKTYRYSASIRVFFSPRHIRVIFGGLELDLLSFVDWKRGTVEAIGHPEHPLANQLMCKAAKAEGSIYSSYESYPREGPHRVCVSADEKTFEALVVATDRLAYVGKYWGVTPRPFGFLGDPYAEEAEVSHLKAEIKTLEAQNWALQAQVATLNAQAEEEYEEDEDDDMEHDGTLGTTSASAEEVPSAHAAGAAA